MEDGIGLDRRPPNDNCRRCFAVGEFISIVFFFAVERLLKSTSLDLATFCCLVIIGFTSYTNFHILTFKQNRL